MFHLPHPVMQLSFVLLSLADLALTWTLIHNGSGSIYESNPVAAWCLRCQGWIGLAIFKAVMVLSILALSVVISRCRPRLGGRVLALGCGVTASVVLYSGYLCFDVASAEPPAAEPIVLARSHRIERDSERLHHFLHLENELAGKLADGRCDLSEALATYEPAAKEQNLTWLKGLSLSAGVGSDREGLAIRLMSVCVAKRSGRPQAARELAARLIDEYSSLFGTPPPWLKQPKGFLVWMPATAPEAG
jgi:hypothetical protein